MPTEVRVPTLGESVTEATVATWFKKPGDSVAVDEMLCELETDKVTVEVPSPAAGKLSDIVAQEGETVGVDALLANIAESGEAGATEPKERPAEAKTEEETSGAADGAASGGGSVRAAEEGFEALCARRRITWPLLVAPTVPPRTARVRARGAAHISVLSSR